MKTHIIHEAKDLPYSPRIEKTARKSKNPSFITIYGSAVIHHGKDSLEAFEEHGRNMRHAAESAGLLENQ